MAIKKPGSRPSDRRKIRSYHAQGYSVPQIASMVSVVEEHVQYVLEKWDIDEESWKEREKARVEREQAAAMQARAPADLEAKLRAEIEAKVREEMRIEAEVKARLAAEVNDEVGGVDDEPAAPRRRRGRPKSEESDE